MLTIPSNKPRYSLMDKPTTTMLHDYRDILRNPSWKSVRSTNCEVDDDGTVRYCAGAWIMKNLYGSNPYMIRGTATTISSLIHTMYPSIRDHDERLMDDPQYQQAIDNADYIYRIATLHDRGDSVEHICAIISQWIIKEETIANTPIDDTIHHGPDE